MKPGDLSKRRERVRRVNARRPPPIGVDVAYAPEPGAREQLVDLLFELLEARRHSGRGSAA